MREAPMLQIPPLKPPGPPNEPVEPAVPRSTLVYVKEPLPKWEYKHLQAEAASLPDESALNELGAAGWELAGIVPHGAFVTFYFKRQVR